MTLWIQHEVMMADLNPLMIIWKFNLNSSMILFNSSATNIEKHKLWTLFDIIELPMMKRQGNIMLHDSLDTSMKS